MEQIPCTTDLITCPKCGMLKRWEGDVYDAHEGYQFPCRDCAEKWKTDFRKSRIDWLMEHALCVMTEKEIIAMVDEYE